MHLVLLVSFGQQEQLQGVDILLNTAPLFFLLADWMFNRIYLNLFLLSAYPFVCYSLFAGFEYLLKPTLTVPDIPELSVFDLKWEVVGWLLPALVPLAIYFATRLKYLFLDEGDIEQLKFWSMIGVVE